MSLAPWLLERLACPVCQGSLSVFPDEEILGHTNGKCAEAYPVIDGIPRLVLGAHRAMVVRTHSEWFRADPRRKALATVWRGAGGRAMTGAVVGDFDYEWSHFAAVGGAELRRIASGYFDQVPDALFAPDRVVLDAGCGAGRWAHEVASRGARVIALDLGQSVEIARRNTRALGGVACVQADVHDLPFITGSLDWVYSLGVLHHVESPGRALDELVRGVRRSGLVLIYLYYALDGRGPIFRGLFALVDGLRQLTSRAPRWVALAIAAAVATIVYWPLARLGRLVARFSPELADQLPLSFYRELSFRMMLNDSLDRFGTRIERRYTRKAFVALLRAGGLRDIQVSNRPPFWHGIGLAERGTGGER